MGHTREHATYSVGGQEGPKVEGSHDPIKENASVTLPGEGGERIQIHVSGTRGEINKLLCEFLNREGSYANPHAGLLKDGILRKIPRLPTNPGTIVGAVKSIAAEGVTEIRVDGKLIDPNALEYILPAA